MTSYAKYIGGGVAAFGFLVLVVGCNPVAVVDEGNVGLVTELGKAKEVRGPGVTLINPFTQDVREFETRIRPLKFENIDAASQELQSVKLTGTLNYSVDASAVINLYRTVGLDYQGRVLNAALNDVSKATTPQYPVNEILAKRPEVSSKIVAALNERLKEHGITVHDLFLENIAFSPEFQKAIEEKQTAAQTAEKEVQVTIQRREQANQAIESAKGQAEANRLLTASLTDEIVRYEAVKKWDGKLPQVQGSADTLISLGAK
jgi:regulator of protease activity HflC (stomatin/prohibitin superfamily)